MQRKKSKKEPSNTSEINSNNDKSPNIDEILNETLKLIESSKIKSHTIKNLHSYQNFKQIYVTKYDKPSFLKKLISYWDILILTILLIIFSLYLAFFLSAYFSSDLNYKLSSYQKIRKVKNWLIAEWMYFNDFTDLTKEKCALILPDFSNSVTRPIEDCTMCTNLNEIKRISNISREEFLEKYAYTGVPVIITDAIKNWSALKKFNFKFLKDLYLNLDEQEYRKRQSKLDIHNDKSSAILNTFNHIIEDDKQREDSNKITCQFFPYKTNFKNLNQVFEMDLDENGKWPKPWYVGWSNCNNYASKVLREHYERPYFLPEESEMSRLDWIFMGTPGYGASIHIDDVTNPSWQAQISGIKHWTFRPPAECLFKCPFNLYADVYPGDIIIFDSNRWFHSTLIIGNDLSLTIGSEYD